MAKTNILVLTKTFWRHLEDVFWRCKAKANIFVLIKTSWRRLLKTKTKDVLKTSSPRRMFPGFIPGIFIHGHREAIIKYVWDLLFEFDIWYMIFELLYYFSILLINIKNNWTSSVQVSNSLVTFEIRYNSDTLYIIAFGDCISEMIWWELSRFGIVGDDLHCGTLFGNFSEINSKLAKLLL